jgi:hypothetical protein
MQDIVTGDLKLVLSMAQRWSDRYRKLSRAIILVFPKDKGTPAGESLFPHLFHVLDYFVSRKAVRTQPGL